MKILSIFTMLALSSLNLFSAQAPQATLNPFPTYRAGYKLPITTTITYVSKDQQGSNLSPCSATIAIDGSEMVIYNEKPFSPELLAVLLKDYKLVIEQMMSLRTQINQKVLAAYHENAAYFGPAVAESDLWEEFFTEIFDRIEQEAFSKNPLAKDFQETFEVEVRAMRGAEEFSKRMSSVSCDTLAYQVEMIEYQLQHEATYHHFQKADEVYISTFVVPGIAVPMNQGGFNFPITTTITYASDDKQGSNLRPHEIIISINGTKIMMHNDKPCSPALLAALQKDYKLVIAQAMQAKKQADQKIFATYVKDVTRLAPALDESDIYDEFSGKMFEIKQEEFSKNLLVKDFFETFSTFICVLDGADEFSKKMRSIPAELFTLAHEMEGFEYEMKHEDMYHHLQKALEVYMATFLRCKN